MTNEDRKEFIEQQRTNYLLNKNMAGIMDKYNQLFPLC